MAKRKAGGGLELSPAEVQTLRDALEIIALGVGVPKHDPDADQDEEERRRQAKQFAAHVRWHVKRPHRSRSCQFCP